MSIRDLKREQDEGFLLRDMEEKALQELDKKLIVFSNEALPGIFQTVETRARVSSVIVETRVSEPLERRTPRSDLLPVIRASLTVPGTKLRVTIDNSRYTYTTAVKEGGFYRLLFKDWNSDDYVIRCKTGLDRLILPFDLVVEGIDAYSFIWNGMEDNTKIINAIMRGLEGKSLPRSDFDSRNEGAPMTSGFIATLIDKLRRR